ncbi:hypothetical protein [Dendronalium sp. ChiSLP03b]
MCIRIFGCRGSIVDFNRLMVALLRRSLQTCVLNQQTCILNQRTCVLN